MIRFKRLTTVKGPLYIMRLGSIMITLDSADGELLFNGRNVPYWLRPDTYIELWQEKWRYSPFPIYWDRYSRDCDQFAVSWCERHKNGWTAYRSMCDAYDNAEGPETFSFITKAEYILHKNERHTRDHAAEQMNY